MRTPDTYKIVVVWVNNHPELWLCVMDADRTWLPVVGPLVLPPSWTHFLKAD
jgi:hypothetical protein